jgi:hypothetical protein
MHLKLLNAIGEQNNGRLHSAPATEATQIVTVPGRLH